MPVILVTNDDGIHSEGIIALYNVFREIGKVYVAAPDREQSAVGHALTLHRPLRVEEVEESIYSVNGTPTDCVTIAVNKLLPVRPDLIVSGINRGGNLGDDVTYSGTVSAAIEGTLLGIPSLAISIVTEMENGKWKAEGLHFTDAAQFAGMLGKDVLDKGLPSDTLLNMNVPNKSTKEIKGIKFTRQGKRTYDNSIKEMYDPRGRKHYWIGGGNPLWEQGEDTDFKAIQDGYISVTPIHLDLTNYDALNLLKKDWLKKDWLRKDWL